MQRRTIAAVRKSASNGTSTPSSASHIVAAPGPVIHRLPAATLRRSPDRPTCFLQNRQKAVSRARDVFAARIRKPVVLLDQVGGSSLLMPSSMARIRHQAAFPRCSSIRHTFGFCEFPPTRRIPTNSALRSATYATARSLTCFSSADILPSSGVIVKRCLTAPAIDLAPARQSIRHAHRLHDSRPHSPCCSVAHPRKTTPSGTASQPV